MLCSTSPHEKERQSTWNTYSVVLFYKIRVRKLKVKKPVTKQPVNASSMTSISLVTRNIFCSFPMIWVNCHRIYLVSHFHVCHSPSKGAEVFFNPLSFPLSLSFSHQHPSENFSTICKQFCNFARGWYHLVNENAWPSAPRERTTIYYSTLHCYRFVNAPLIRDENERKINPTPKLAFPFPPIQKPSPYLRAYQRAISIQNEPIIARKIQRCSLLCSWVLFIDSNSLL